MNINILDENGNKLISINDSYFNEKLIEFTHFIQNFKENFYILDTILESRFDHSIDSIALNLYQSDFLNLLNLDSDLDLEKLLFNTFNLLFNIENNKFVSTHVDDELFVLFSIDNSYYLFETDSLFDSIMLKKFDSLSDVVYYFDNDISFLDKDILEYDELLSHIHFLLNSR